MAADPLEQLASRAAQVHRLARESGFALVGIAPARASDHAEHIRAWLAGGHQGQMNYLSDPAKLRQMLDPRNLVPGAQTVICVVDFYVAGTQPQALSAENTRPSPLPESGGPSEGRGSEPTGRIARYAWGDDYHRVIKDRLHKLADALRAVWPEHIFRAAVDTAPVLEREHAQRAGLGWVGKHTLLIHPHWGSWFFLGEIITTLALQTTAEAGTAAGGSPSVFTDGFHGCGTCTRCIDACPTSCISPYALDARRCISYLTIEYKGTITQDLHGMMGDWIAGCDVCQEVCPFNGGTGDGSARDSVNGGVEIKVGAKATAPHVQAGYAPRPPAPAISLLEVLNWDAAARQKAFRRSALKRIKLDRFRRNALIAAGNALTRREDDSLLSRIKELAADAGEAESVRETARQVLARLTGAVSARAAARAPEGSAGPEST